MIHLALFMLSKLLAHCTMNSEFCKMRMPWKSDT